MLRYTRAAWLLLPVLLAVVACDGAERPAVDPEPAPLHVPADTGLAGFFQHGPVYVGASRSELVANLGEPDSVAVRTVSNRHDPTMTDSIVTLFYDGLSAEIHVAGYDGKEILAALVVDSDRFLQDGTVVRIGDGSGVVRAALGEPDEATDEQLLYICDDCLAAGQETVRFVMRNDAVARIEVRYWVD